MRVDPGVDEKRGKGGKCLTLDGTGHRGSGFYLLIFFLGKQTNKQKLQKNICIFKSGNPDLDMAKSEDLWNFDIPCKLL